MRQVCACCAATLLVAGVALAQDNVEGGWGAWFGGNYAAANTTTMPITFQPGGEVEVAWTFDAHDEFGILGLKGRQQIVFDADGNLYWVCGNTWWLDHSKLVSLSPAGELRWTYPADSSGTLGYHERRQTPIVGADAVYLASHIVPVYDDGDPPEFLHNSWYVYAVNKEDGSEIWATQLDNEWETFNETCMWPNMTLLNGKLYTIGAPHENGDRAVYVIDAATGAILHNQTIGGLPSDGTMADTNLLALQDLLGDGVDRLYGTWGEEVWCIEIDYATPADTDIDWIATVASQDWMTRKHVMYSEELGMILTYGKNTVYGYETFALDPVEGDVYYDWGDADDGAHSDTFQSGALGFYDDSTETLPLYTGAYPAAILEYVANEDGVNYVRTREYDPGYWETVGCFMQILQNPTDGHTIAVTATVGVPSTILMIDLSEDESVKPEEGPLYIDDVKYYAGPDTANLTLVFEDDFESYTPGSIVGQGGWLDASEAGSSEGPSQVIADPTGGDNQVLELSPVAGDESWEGVKQSLSLPDANVYRIEYRQYASDSSQNIYVMLTNDPDNADQGCPWSMAWDGSGVMSAIGYEHTWEAETSLAVKTWEAVVITHDYVNEQSDILLGGTKSDVGSWRDGDDNPTDFYPVNKPNGLALQLEDTTKNANMPAAVIVSYDLGNTTQAYLRQQVAGGPLVGPDGKIYFGFSDDEYHNDEPRAGEIWALQPAGDTLCADANCDGAVNAFDIDPFVQALVSPTEWQLQHDCELLEACDINADGAVNAFDIDAFVAALVAGGCP